MEEIVNENSLESAFSLASILKAIIIIGAGWFSAKLASRLFYKALGSSLSIHDKSIYGRIIFYSIFFLFAATAIHQLGFQITVLLGAAGILTVAIGFASQTSASNLISGLFLISEKPFEIGDILRVDGETGEVTSIDLLSVKIRTFDNLYVRVPNESLIKNTFVNLTKYPIRRIDVVVGIAYKEKIEKAIELLLSIANDDIRSLEEPAPFCIVTNFNSSSIDLQLSIWTRRENIRDLKSDVMKRVKELFDEHDIEIPFPHVSLYTGSTSEPFPVVIKS